MSDQVCFTTTPLSRIARRFRPLSLRRRARPATIAFVLPRRRNWRRFGDEGCGPPACGDEQSLRSRRRRPACERNGDDERITSVGVRCASGPPHLREFEVILVTALRGDLCLELGLEVSSRGRSPDQAKRGNPSQPPTLQRALVVRWSGGWERYTRTPRPGA